MTATEQEPSSRTSWHLRRPTPDARKTPLPKKDLPWLFPQGVGLGKQGLGLRGKEGEGTLNPKS